MKIWSIATPTKSKNSISTTARTPLIARPIAKPTVADSQSGPSRITSSPYLSQRPRVTPNVPPCGPMSCPRCMTGLSPKKASSSALLIASPIVNSTACISSFRPSFRGRKPFQLRFQQEATTMRIGLDSYSFHRLLGELRAGEEDPGERLSDGGPAVVAEARRLALDGGSLETCYLDPPSRLDLDALRDAAGPLELVLAWGAPNGLELGARPDALAGLHEW